MRVDTPQYKWYTCIHIPSITVPETIQDEHVRRIVSIVRDATAFEYLSGVLWYPTYQELIESEALKNGLSAEQGIALFAVLSPQRFVSWNWKLFVDACRDKDPWNMPIMGQEKRKVAAILAGDLDVVRGMKVRAFASNLAGDYSQACVDRHAISALLDEQVSKITNSMYRYAARVYTAAAQALNMPVAHVQAITWLVQKRKKGNIARPDNIFVRLVQFMIKLIVTGGNHVCVA